MGDSYTQQSLPCLAGRCSTDLILKSLHSPTNWRLHSSEFFFDLRKIHLSLIQSYDVRQLPLCPLEIGLKIILSWGTTWKRGWWFPTVRVIECDFDISWDDTGSRTVKKIRNYGRNNERNRLKAQYPSCRRCWRSSWLKVANRGATKTNWMALKKLLFPEPFLPTITLCFELSISRNRNQWGKGLQSVSIK